MRGKILIISLVLLITGCSKNELVCNKKTKNAGYDYQESYNLVYDDNSKLNYINLTLKSIYNEHYTDVEILDEYNEVYDYCDFYQSSSHKLIECKPDLDDNILTVKIKIKVNKIDDDLFEDMMYVTKEEISDIKKAKKMLENVGYSCK